jgi:hypothetical protein
VTVASEVSTLDRRTLTVTLEEAEPMPAAYSSTPRLFRPTRLTAEWTRRDGGEWQMVSAKASGPLIKKNGADSSLFGEHHLGSYRAWRDDAPTWARSMTEAHAPVAEVTR